MDFTVDKQVICTKEELKTETAEHPVDCEAVLPDYCPDISRVLKCKTTPIITNERWGEGGGIVEGNVLVEVLYVDGQGELFTYTQSIPITHELTGPEKATAGQVTAKMQYCNCRAVSTRKVEIHGVVGIKVVFTTLRDISFVTAAKGMGVELLSKEEQVTTVSACVQKAFTITDELPISSGSVRRILRSSGVVQSVSCKLSESKVVLNGDLAVCALYQNGEGGYEIWRATLPFAQLIEANGLEEGDECRYQLRIISLELRPRTGLDGECKNLSLTAQVMASVEGHRTLTIPIVTEGYSTQCGLGIRRLSGELQRYQPLLTEEYTCKNRLELGREWTSVLDFWCEAQIARVKTQQNRLVIEGDLLCGILGLDSDNTVSYLEKTMDFCWERELILPEGEIRCTPSVEVVGNTFSFGGSDVLEVRVQMQITVPIHCQLQNDVVAELVPDPAVTPPKLSVPLVIYYGQKGERVFDIARRYYTSCGVVCQANNIENGVLSEKKALLIPLV